MAELGIETQVSPPGVLEIPTTAISCAVLSFPLLLAECKQLGEGGGGVLALPKTFRTWPKAMLFSCSLVYVMFCHFNYSKRGKKPKIQVWVQLYCY